MTDYLHDRVTAAIGSQYLVAGEIGRGSSGVVYRATDLRLNRLVAIKILPPELGYNPDVRTRFVREAQTAAQLSHPNIVPIYSVDEREGLVYFVMALVEGESAAAGLAREPRWPIERTIRTLREVADGLAYAHSRGVVHRDVKPDNILIDRASGRALVTDFGIARAAAVDTRLTVTGMSLGTPAYMSPEQAIGERELDGRSDLYSLGVVGFQMLVGETPFRATSTLAMMRMHVSDPPPRVRDRRPDVPAYLASAIDRCLEKRPEDRWSSASEFHDALVGNAPAVEPRRTAKPLPTPALVGEPAPRSVPPLQAAYGAAADARAPWDWTRYAELPVEPFAQVAPPAGLSGKELRRWLKEQHRQQRLAQRLVVRAAVRGLPYDDRPIWRRVTAFRGSVVGFAFCGIPAFMLAASSRHGGPVVLALILNAILVSNILRRGGSLWSDGIGPIEAFKKGLPKKLREMDRSAPAGSRYDPLADAQSLQMTPNAQGVRVAPPRRGPAPGVDPATALAPPEVLAGGYGDAVRRAASDRAVVRDIVARLTGIEKEMLPDVAPTVDALVERVASLSITLHRLDAEVSGGSLGSLDDRIAALKKETATPEQERRVALLERQRVSLHDLLERRRTLANQLESASVALQNLKLDLLKLRSAGVDAAIQDVTSATQEARAVSRDISRLMEVADDLRKI